MTSVLMWFGMFNLNLVITLTSDLGGHVTNKISDCINMGQVTLVSFSRSLRPVPYLTKNETKLVKT